MIDKKEVIEFCLKLDNTYEDYPFDKKTACMRIKKTKKIFALIFVKDGHVWVNVKCDPQWRDVWRGTYEMVIPGFHMNKQHWNSVILDGSVPENEVKRMIEESYDLCK